MAGTQHQGGNYEQNQQEDKRPFWQKLTLFQKIIILLLVAGLLYLLFFWGQPQNVYGLIVFALFFAVFTFGVYFLISSLLGLWGAKKFFPKETKLKNLIGLATVQCPENLKSVVVKTMGSKLFRGSELGKCEGVVRLPYLSGHLKKDPEGNILYKMKANEKGEQVPVIDERGNKLPERVYAPTNESEIFVIAKRGRLFPKFLYLRFNEKYLASWDGEIIVDTANFVDYGNFWYPYEQYKQKIDQIMTQNLEEVLITTYEYQHDLISVGVDDALKFNPIWQYQRRVGTESIANPNEGGN